MATAHDSMHRSVDMMNLPLTALWPTYGAVESLPWILNFTALWPAASAVVRNTRNMVYKKHREIQYSYVSKIDLKIQ